MRLAPDKRKFTPLQTSAEKTLLISRTLQVLLINSLLPLASHSHKTIIRVVKLIRIENPSKIATTEKPEVPKKQCPTVTSIHR